MNDALESLLQHPGLWRGRSCAEVALPSVPSVPSGYAELDARLPGGGWPTGALTEILPERQGIGELRLLLPALARLSREDRWLLWIAPPYIPYAPALAAAGLALENLLWLRPDSPADALWAAEQALRSGACSAVLAWPDRPDGRALRRLQLAAEEGRALAVLFRPAAAAVQSSTAALRLGLQSVRSRLQVRILKRRRGCVAAPFLLDTDNAALAGPVLPRPAPGLMVPRAGRA